jgi:hypothetical protein
MQLVLDLLAFVLPMFSKQMESLVMMEMNVLKQTFVKEEIVLELDLANVVMVYFKQQLENNVMLVL